MAYADLLQDESATSNYLAIIKPRKRETGFSVFSGSVYSASFGYHVASVSCDGTALTEVTTTSLNAGEFYYDTDSETLYVRTPASGNPNSIYTVVTFEVYLGSIDAHWYRVPTDSGTRVVYFEPIIQRSPMIKQSQTDAIFGFNPIQSSTLTAINSEYLFNPIMHGVSYNKAEIRLYHWLGAKLDTANISRVLLGFIDSISLNQPQVSFRITDRTDELSNEFRHESTVENFYTIDTHAELNTFNEGNVVRKVFGRVEGFIPVNIDYLSESPTTSDNRTWAVVGGQDGLADVVQTVSASPASTTTRTYLDSLNGLQVGDTVLIDKASDESAEITFLGVGYIDHTTIGVAASPGDTVKRAFVSRINIVQEDVEYAALYGRDYTVSTALAGGKSGFVFDTNLESNLGMPNTLSGYDKIYCTVYGPRSIVTLGGPAFGTNDTRTDNSCHPAQIVLYLLKSIGIPESEIDSASFTASLSTLSSGIGIAIADSNGAKSFPKIRDIISDLTKTALFKLFIDDTGKYSLYVTGPLGTSDFTAQDDEILANSISFNYDYSEMVSDVTVKYNKREDNVEGTNLFDSSTVSSDNAKYVHSVNSTKEIESLWAFETEATELATRLSYYLGDSIGSVTIRVKNRFYSAKVGDVITIERSQLTGYTVDNDTLRSRDYIVTSIDKSRNEVTLQLDDQKGIEDNSGGGNG